MTPFEWLALAYFAFLAAAAAARRARPRVWLYLGSAAALVIVSRFRAPWEIRAWIPHAYLVLGYWIPAAFTSGLHAGFERWLRRADAALFERFRIPAPGTASRNASWTTLLEAAYLLCYPLVPATFLVVFLLGDRGAVVRFWVAVLVAGYACYGTLPWTAARPPRLLPSPDAARSPGNGLRAGVARLNAHVLSLVSHNLTTFPSGHVAVSMAAALACLPLSTSWGGAFLALAAAIAAAAVAGRYHYLIDVLAGAIVGALAWAAASVAAGA
jgi:membrane-associated phospholipid phosphatase